MQMYQQIPRQSDIRDPQYYQQKAAQLKMENQLLKRQLQKNKPSSAYTHSFPAQKQETNRTVQQGYTFQKSSYQGQPSQSRATLPNQYSQAPQFPNCMPQKNQSFILRGSQSDRVGPAQQSYYDQSPTKYRTEHIGGSGSDRERHTYINELEDKIIELQTRSYKLEREANQLSSYIKEDLREFVHESNIHKECSYKQKYMRAIANRPKYFRFNM